MVQELLGSGKGACGAPLWGEKRAAVAVPPGCHPAHRLVAIWAVPLRISEPRVVVGSGLAFLPLPHIERNCGQSFGEILTSSLTPPRPGSLKRGLVSHCPDDGSSKRSRTSSVSSLNNTYTGGIPSSIRNAIASSYSSSRGLVQVRGALVKAAQGGLTLLSIAGLIRRARCHWHPGRRGVFVLLWAAAGSGVTCPSVHAARGAPRLRHAAAVLVLHQSKKEVISPHTQPWLFCSGGRSR